MNAINSERMVEYLKKENERLSIEVSNMKRSLCKLFLCVAFLDDGIKDNLYLITEEVAKMHATEILNIYDDFWEGTHLENTDMVNMILGVRNFLKKSLGEKLYDEVFGILLQRYGYVEEKNES